MVFVFTRISDATTIDLIRWLLHFGKTFFRFNTTISLSQKEISSSPTAGADRSSELFGSNITSLYFNGGSVLAPPGRSNEAEMERQVSTYLRSEASAFLEFELSMVSSDIQFGLSPFSKQKINKLKVLKAAKNVGLNVPETSIVNTKSQLRKLLGSWGRVINKSIDDGIEIETEDVLVSGQRTEEITEATLEGLDEIFFPSLFQQLIEKDFEVRVFYFRGEFNSIAIFSQANSASVVDSRNVDYSAPSRQVPFSLPGDIKEKIILLMDALELNYGSIDLVVGAANKYYFLEVNPYGQYGFLSAAGNFYLEKQIAEYL